ncbi:MAG: hypothetical protein CMB99_12010 [Flavobacteriaceae bacterium]|nr:hypothetical protein [Flavobacteriaceae bacterium]
MIHFNSKFFLELAKAIGKLIIAGVFIGLLKEYDFIIAILLLLKIAYNLYRNFVTRKEKNWLLIVGMILTGIGGIIGEIWGVTNGFWEYHEISGKLPYWLPFAWMLAFDYLYKVEKALIPFLVNPTHRNKIVLAIILALILPALGEMVTIYLGVWTYYWPYQLLGVPLYAFICLVFVHMLVYSIMNAICRKYKIKDPVFT